jgi:hypothetical protein
MNVTALPDRIGAKVVPVEDGCWLWAGHVAKNGYGQTWMDGAVRYAHRTVYELLVGPITAATLDHLCRVRSCVNPDHLEPVSMGENTLRGDTISARNAAKTHCLRGHEFNEANTYVWRGRPLGRMCRACNRDQAAERRARIRGEN